MSIGSRVVSAVALALAVAKVPASPVAPVRAGGALLLPGQPG